MKARAMTHRISSARDFMRDFCVTQWCFVVLSGDKCNGRHAASD